MGPEPSQIALPLPGAGPGARRIVIGDANRAVAAALSDPSRWPFRTAVLTGPPRSGKSLFARWFAATGRGAAIDDAPALPETELFHRWNRAQEDGTALLLIGGVPPWRIALPDLHLQGRRAAARAGRAARPAAGGGRGRVSGAAHRPLLRRSGAGGGRDRPAEP